MVSPTQLCWRYHSLPLSQRYVSLGILKLTGINKYLIARFMYKYCINMVPRLFSSFFLRNYNVSTYDLRSANCFNLPLVSTDFGKNGIRYRGPIVFNKLLLDGIDSTVSEAVFVNQLKMFVKFISVSKGRRLRKGLASSPFRLRGRIGMQAYWVGRPSPKDPKE